MESIKMKELVWEENYSVRNDIEDSTGNRLVDERQVLTILENCITELYDLPNPTRNSSVEPKEEIMQS
jgi:hypothetical protein